MQKNSTEIKALRNYYQGKGLTIIGMNDSQGVKLLSSPFSKGFLEQIVDTLETPTFKPFVINGFSLIMNKAEHIDYMLSADLSLEELKLSQAYGTQAAIEHASYNQFPRFRKPIESIMRRPIKLLHRHPSLGVIGMASQLIYRVNPGDEQIRLATELAKAEEPTFIYSSGINNLMREIANNPYSLPNDYDNRNKTPNYNYSLSRVKDIGSIKRPMKAIERSFEHILTINPNTDIYVIGAYRPKRLYRTGLESFREAIIEYNEALEALCNSYGLSFIDTEYIAQATLDKKRVHLPKKGAYSVANLILMKMYERKINNDMQSSKIEPHYVEDKPSSQNSSERMTGFIQRDIDEAKAEKQILDETFEVTSTNMEEFNFPTKPRILAEYEFPSKVKGQEIEEHQREQKVFQLVQNQTTRRKV